WRPPAGRPAAGGRGPDRGTRRGTSRRATQFGGERVRDGADDGEGALRLDRVDGADREPDVHDHVVTDTRLRCVGKAHLPAYPVEVDGSGAQVRAVRRLR